MISLSKPKPYLISVRVLGISGIVNIARVIDKTKLN